MEFLGSEIQSPISFRDTTNINADNIISSMQLECNSENIPAVFRKDVVTSGGMFNKKKYECVIVSHPNPPQSYCAQVYVIAGDTILFHFFGNSKAFRDNNTYERVKSGQGSSMETMKYMFKQPDKVALQMELTWHNKLISAFNSLVN